MGGSSAARPLLGPVVVLTVIVLVVAGCRDAGIDGGPRSVSDAVDAPSAGCSPDVPPIAESGRFVPYDGRLSHSMAAAVIDWPGVGSATSEERLDGLPLAAFTGHPDDTYAALFATDYTPGTTYSRLYRSGALVLDVAQGPPGESLADSLAADPDTGDQVVRVRVADHLAALTRADPDEAGVRPHHVIWTDDRGRDHDLSGVRRPEELVGLARRLACGTSSALPA